MRSKSHTEFVVGCRAYASRPFEIVERKGVGHPDTLADTLAEHLSVVYSRYTLQHFGAVLHHNFDKVGLMGGKGQVTFGNGALTEPVRVLLNGRASSKFGDTLIPVRELLTETARAFLAERFPMLDPERDIRMLFEVSTGSSPGAVVTEASNQQGRRPYWFEPRGLEDLPERKRLVCNDTSLGCAFVPGSDLERMVFGLEQMLASPPTKQAHPWLGSDIKMMAKRIGSRVHCTIAIPQIAAHVPNLAAYRDNLATVYELVIGYCRQHYPQFQITVALNARDDYEAVELYLTSTGSSIETGDEGFVGRGNRLGGVIAPMRPYTMEGICGKNPVYHTGKLYCVAAHEIATRLHQETGAGAVVYLIGQTGQPLTAPWQTFVELEADCETGPLEPIIQDTLAQMDRFTTKLLNGEYQLC